MILAGREARFRPGRRGSRHWPALAALPVAACGHAGSPSTLSPISADAARLERLWWVMFAISMAVFAVVLALLVVALRRRKRPPDLSPSADRRGQRWVMWAGLIVPTVILAGVWVLVVLDLRALSDEGGGDRLIVEVTGKQWWWDVRYPQLEVVTANEIHVPAGEPVEFRLTSGDVQHSFWVPRAGPKRDMYPDRVNSMVLQFDEAGEHFGICSEFCGLQHARMQFLVVAQTQEEFDAWASHQAAPARTPEAELEAAGRQVFLQSGCVGCHTIRGVSEASDVGPDLTHLADREILAADVDVPRDQLLEFVHDPHTIKEGVLMPPAGLPPEELEALVAYLESLR